MVRIVSWNVNGLRTLRPTVQAALDRLDADIICLQETRVSKADKDLERLALVPGYDSFFSFCTVRTGYSGVATFTRKPETGSKDKSPENFGESLKDVKDVTPRDAGEGFEGSAGAAGAFCTSCDCTNHGEFARKSVHEIPNSNGKRKDGAMSRDCRVPLAEDLNLIRDEGRVVITDHHKFVLINVYVPAVTVEDRVRFKLAFCQALEWKVRCLRAARRPVIIVGDFNIAPHTQDRAEAVADLTDFHRNPSRRWLLDVMLGELGFVDAFRQYYPHEKNQFTCWSEATRARETNYGVRIDLILVDKELFESEARGAGIMPHVTGSDHCPVTIELRDEPYLVNNRSFSGPPPFCTQFLPRFWSKQRSILDVFAKCSQVVVKDQSVESNETQDEVAAGTANKVPKNGVAESRKTKFLPEKRRRLNNFDCTNTTLQQSRILSFFKRSSAESRPASVNDDSANTERSREYSTPDEAEAPRSLSQEGCCEVSRQSTKQKPLRLTDGSGSKSETNWKELLKGPPAPPLCRHREACHLKVVRKAGPNRGRSFYSCARAAGNWPTDKNANCNFFQWAPFTANSTMSRLYGSNSKKS